MANAYDSAVFLRNAARLNSQASSLVAKYAIAGAILGFVLGLPIAGLASGPGSVGMGVAVVCLIIGALGGFQIGSTRAEILRLQAQTLLWQVQMEAIARQSLEAQYASRSRVA